MAQNRRHLTDTYKESFCCVCGTSGVNQFYGIHESYIDYCGDLKYLSEILDEVLSVNMSEIDENTIEICQDCKDKLVKFYHFKRKAHEVQSQIKHFQTPLEKVSLNIENNQDASNDDYNQDLTTASSYEDNNHGEVSKREGFKIQSAVSLNEEILIKEEPEEPPDIVFADYSSDFSTPDYPAISQLQRIKRQSNRRGDAGPPISKAALKMRLYRERLKLPENRQRFLQHQRQQREYNRRHYMRKQGADVRRKRRVNYNEAQDDDFDDIFLLP